MKKDVRSPFTGGRVVLVEEKRDVVYRGYAISFKCQFYKCVDTDELFTDTSLDEENMQRLYSSYRELCSIPSASKIKEIREKYKLSAVKMSEILGLGINQYRLYESGEMPSEMIGRTLSIIENPDVFKMFVSLARKKMNKRSYEKISRNLSL